MLIGIVRGWLGGDEGKMPIRDESLYNPITIISSFEEESSINGMVDFVLAPRLDVYKSNWSSVTIFPCYGKEMV